MTSNEHPREDDEEAFPQDAEVDLATQDIAAHAEERFDVAARVPSVARLRFAALVLVVLLVHAAVIAWFLWRDQNDKSEVAQITETPVEVVVEPPPEEKPPPPPTPPEPDQPKPKEDLRDALSAPRAPSETKVDTNKIEEKTTAPKAAAPPTDAQKTPTPQTAPPKDEAPAETQKDETAKEEDKTKPDAEALDKAKVKPDKQSKTKAAKAAPKSKKTSDLLASLSGESLSPEISFTKPTPKTKIYGGTEDVRWMSEVEAMLEAKVSQLPRTAHWQDGGHVAIFFHVDVSGRVISKEIIVKSGYPDIDAIAMKALAEAAPFPPPPPGIERGLVWGSKFDGQLPKLHIEKR